MSRQQLNISREEIEKKIREITCGQEGSEKKVFCPDVEQVEGTKLLFLKEKLYCSLKLKLVDFSKMQRILTVLY
jgi:hypothetical protein